MGLDARVAIVTGASRGVGKGIALELARQGATVVVVGRSETETPDFPGTIHQTVQEIEALGGRALAVKADITDDAVVKSLVARVWAELGRIDILVNNAIGGVVPGEKKFWERPLEEWDAVTGVGLRAHYVASHTAIPYMLRQETGGLIANISSGGAVADVPMFPVAYGVVKAGLDRLAQALASQLRDTKVAVVSLWPGMVATERMKKLAEARGIDLSRAEDPALTGKAIAWLYENAPTQYSGQRLVVAALAREKGFG
ncbi:MAG: SDR family NAD(P)-dependent oxidoreductase [Chloroflexi bacterium]|nr:SDR family NAD(P)-dependent oxidoreductase [Chloroflexota bacterium]